MFLSLYSQRTKWIIFLFLNLFIVLDANGQSDTIDLMMHLKMNGDVLDATKYKNDGSLSGATSVDDQFSNPFSAYYFNGISDYIVVKNSASLNPVGGFTVSAWYKTTPFTGSGNDAIVNKAYTSHVDPFYQYHLGVSGNGYWNLHSAFQFDVCINNILYGVTTGSNYYELYKWYYIVGTYDGTAMKLYVNGVLVSSLNVSGSISVFNQDLYIGRHQNYNGGVINHLKGTIDDVKIYRRALTAGEIINQYNNDKNNLVASYQYLNLCDNSKVNFTYTGYALHDSVKWNFGDGTSSDELNPVHAYNLPGKYKVILDMYYNGTRYRESKYVTLTAYPKVDLGRDTMLCKGEKILLDAGSDGESYLWSNNSTSQKIEVSSNGNYKVTVSNSCGAITDDIQVGFYGENDIDVFTDTTVCKNSDFSYKVKGSDDYDYLWDNSIAGKVYQLKIEENKNISLKVTFSPSCQILYSAHIYALDKPSIDLGRDTIICENNVIELNAQNVGCAYLWNDGTTLQYLLVDDAGTYSVNITNVCGTVSDAIEIDYFKSSAIDFFSDTTICRYSDLIYHITGPDEYTYKWSNGTEGKQFQQTFDNNQTIGLLVTYAKYCSLNFTADVMVNDCLDQIIIPNVFTPNGDGKNDNWVLENIEDYPNASIQVFNRWGLQVYKSNAYYTPWDGLYNGQKVDAGCYYYIIILGNASSSITGPLMIYY